MGLNLSYEYGQTPLDENECEGLLPDTVSTQYELNEHEQLNIESAMGWSLGVKLSADEICTEAFVKALHKKMFGEVWRWAGQFRQSEKNLGIRHHHIATALKQLNDNCLHWIGHHAYSEDEIALRYKHGIVSIHCFSNGNGRHARLMGDLIRQKVFGKTPFSWGAGHTMQGTAKQRERYLHALKEADIGDFSKLLAFAV